jgi:hypothetical protein
LTSLDRVVQALTAGRQGPNAGDIKEGGQARARAESPIPPSPPSLGVETGTAPASVSTRLLRDRGPCPGVRGKLEITRHDSNWPNPTGPPSPGVVPLRPGGL